MHAGPNWSALRTPVQFLTGCGSRQRRSPTGDWPNGMPLKLRTPSLGAAVDSRMPLAVLTRSAAKAGNTAAVHVTMAEKRKRIRGLIGDFRFGNQDLSVADSASGVNASGIGFLGVRRAAIEISPKCSGKRAVIRHTD